MKKEYSDGTTVTGTPPFPALSPRQQALQKALTHLDDIEFLFGGRNGSMIQLRTLLITLVEQEQS